MENFLSTVTANEKEWMALGNLAQDARAYGWNSATVEAIRKGILLAFGG